MFKCSLQTLSKQFIEHLIIGTFCSSQTAENSFTKEDVSALHPVRPMVLRIAATDFVNYKLGHLTVREIDGQCNIEIDRHGSSVAKRGNTEENPLILFLFDFEIWVIRSFGF